MIAAFLKKLHITDSSQILNPVKADTPANLILRPEDALARPVQSTSSPSNNVLLKVTVPKRTGRKRKRGSDEPFTEAPDAVPTEPPQRRNAKDLLRSLRDNPSTYQIQPVGRVERTHVFRGWSRFVFASILSELKKTDCVRHAGFCLFDDGKFLYESIPGKYPAIRL